MTIHGLGTGAGAKDFTPPDKYEKKKLPVQEALSQKHSPISPKKIVASSTPLGDSTAVAQDTARLAKQTLPISPKHIHEQAELFKGSRALAKTSSTVPISPSNVGKDDANDVYMTHFDGAAPDVVFKSGKVAAEKSQMCYGLARLVGIEDSIVPAKRGMATIIARQDVDKLYQIRKEGDKRYLEHRIPLGPLPDKIKNGEVVLSQGIKLRLTREEQGLYSVEVIDTPMDKCLRSTQIFVPLSTDEGVIRLVPKEGKRQEYTVVDGVIICDGKTYSAKQNEDGTYTVTAEPLGLVNAVIDEQFSIERTYDLNYLVLKVEEDEKGANANEVFTDEVGDYVWRHGEKYRLEPSGDAGQFQVVGHDIAGMVQSRVSDVFVGEEGTRLNMLQRSNARTQFYESLDMPSFISAFIATSLLRTQDGKIASDLGESNFLFKDGKTILIDLDETLPASNEAENGVVRVRNGLMGFPQAHELLSDKGKAHATALLEQIIAKKGEAEKFLRSFINDADFDEDHIQSYLAVIEKMEQFLKSKSHDDWSLADLFFAIFPDYQKQWELLGSTDDLAMKALYIGKESQSQIEALVRKRLGKQKIHADPRKITDQGRQADPL